jgi:signal transduction histidine kinase
MIVLSQLTNSVKHMNYTQRLMLAIGSYTFSIMLVVMLGIWAFIEYSEPDDSQDVAFAIHHTVSLLNQTSSKQGNAPTHTEYFDLYLTQSQLPTALRDIVFKPGLTQLENGSSIMMELNPSTQKPYYLLFSTERDVSLIETEFDDILFIIAAVILSTVLTLLMVRWMAKNLATPVITLKEQVETFDISKGHFPRMDRDDEIGQLNHAFGDLIQRMYEFTRREQDFTRFASHELRSPITVIRGNFDILRESLPDSPIHQRIVTRMNTAIQRVSSLIDGFLWLGRENHDTDMPIEAISAARLESMINGLTEHLSPENSYRLTRKISDINWNVRPLMLSILLDNLIRNALMHTDQAVCLSAHGKQLTITNTIGNPTDAEQLGIGLQIVSRICDANHWEYHIDHSETQFSFSLQVNNIKGSE